MSNPDPTSSLSVGQQTTSPEARTSGAAIASFILALLGFCFSLLTGIPAVICGVVALISIGASNGRLRGRGLAVAGIVIACIQVVLIPLMGILVALLLPAVQMARESARRVESKNQLRNIGMAMLNFESSHEAFPPVMSDRQGNAPTISWRVHILPHLEQANLFDRFDRDQPWDSPPNRDLVDPVPLSYQNPNGDIEPGKTNYLAVTGPGTIFPPNAPSSLERLYRRDGASNTIMLVEANAEEAATWTRPKDWEFDPNHPMRGLGEYRYGTFIAQFADGASRAISTDIDPEVLSALFTADGGESVNWDEVDGR